MVFRTTNLLKAVACPEGNKCTLTNCIFGHDLRPDVKDAGAAPTSACYTEEQTHTAAESISTTLHQDSGRGPEPAAKRRKITSERLIGVADSQPVPKSVTRPVSPPPKANGAGNATRPSQTNGAASQSAAKPSAAKQVTVEAETLNPRLIANDPAGHSKRSLYLKHLHGEMVRLNQQLVTRQREGNVQFKPALILTANEIIRLCLDEEEQLAREKGAVYANVIKNRIATYKKMKLDDWITHLKTTSLFQAKVAPGKTQPDDRAAKLDPPQEVDTGLSAPEEVAVARQHLVIKDPKGLTQFGYIPAPPTPEQAAEAAAAVEASKNFEVCDRCAARFQVFPSRDEDGRLTSNGPCRYHPNRKVYPPRTKADLGPHEAYYPCCNEVVGSAGCTTAEWHVFKASSPARLAAILPFITTPDKTTPEKGPTSGAVSAVAFDCEMGHTTLGLELIRLTAVSWPQGEALIDVLVRPYGIVIDLNSRFSGVWPDDIARAVPYQPQSMPPRPQAAPASATTAEPSPTDGSHTSASAPSLPIVDSPEAARGLLCRFLTPKTPLIGHAIENDLNAVRLCHPTVIDTVLTFPHPRGLPMRQRLKTLTAKHLGRQIQLDDTGRGHDSLEDARATGDLVRVNVREKWKRLRAAGWKFTEDGTLVSPPSPPPTAVAAAGADK